MKLRELFETYVSRGSFKSLGGEGLSTLKGLDIPDIIIGNFYCCANHLTSLEFGPKEVDGDFFCYDNFLSSLEHCPTIIGKTFDCSNNQFTSLEFGPTSVGQDFHCQKNKLTSFEFMPKEIDGEVNCHNNQFTSLEHCPNKINGEFDCHKNKITSLQGIHKLFEGGYIKGEFDLNSNPITSHVLGLLLIPELPSVLYFEGNKDCIAAIKIINKHLAGDRDVIDCQQELIEAGLKQFAQL